MRISGITSEGAGVGRLPDGRAVFVHRTAPGDLVRVQVGRIHRRWARARLLELIEPGPDRRQPACPFYATCGGCTLQHLSYDAQLRLKGTFVRDALQRIGGQTALPEPELNPAPREVRYRNRMAFTVARTGTGAVHAGFHALDRPAELVDVDGGCLLPEPPIARAWDALRAAWGPGAALLPPGSILRLTLRSAGEDGVMLVVEGGGTWRDPGALIERVAGLTAIWHRPGGTGDPVLLAGDDGLGEPWYGETVAVTPRSFLQTNREVARSLHDGVFEAGTPASGRRVLDAYCGYGLDGRRLAAAGADVVGIDLSSAGVRLATTSPVPGFRAIQGRVEDKLGEGLPADLVILNPPRGGVGEGVMERLLGARPERIVYVSCDPATLARDVAGLGGGYHISRIRVFDLFPQTSRVETLLVLDRAQEWSVLEGGRPIRGDA